MAVPAFAQPAIPLLFTGGVTIGGEDAPIGTTVSAEIEGVEVASVETSVVGHYAIQVPDGGNVGKTVVFKVNTVVGGSAEYVDPWTTPTVTLDLAIPGAPSVPDISVPASLAFGDVDVGTSSTKTLTISNVGDADLTITEITVTGTQFSVGTYPGTIAAAGSADVNVTFSPTSAGAKSATLTIASDDPDEATVTVSLSGTGVSVAPPPSPAAPSVGGTAYPPDKLAILWPWIGLAVLLAGGIIWFVLRRRRAY